MKYLALLKLMRLHYALPLSSGLAVIVYYVVGGHRDALPPYLPWACLSLFCMIAGAYVMNDCCDIASDRINHPQRLLVTGSLSRSSALVASGLFFLGGLPMALPCPPASRLVIILVGIGLIGYNLYSKRVGILKDFWVAILATSLYPLALTLVNTADSMRVRVLWFHPIWFFCTTVAYEMLKDIGDAPGDQAMHPVKSHYSAQPWFHQLYPKIIGLSLFFLLPPWLLGYCGWIYFVAMSGALLCGIIAMRASTRRAIQCLYMAVVLVTLGSLMDLYRLGV